MAASLLGDPLEKEAALITLCTFVLVLALALLAASEPGPIAIRDHFLLGGVRNACFVGLELHFPGGGEGSTCQLASVLLGLLLLLLLLLWGLAAPTWPAWIDGAIVLLVRPSPAAKILARLALSIAKRSAAAAAAGTSVVGRCCGDLDFERTDRAAF